MGKGGLLIFILAAGTVQCAKESLEIIPSNGDVQLGKQEYFLCKVKSGGEATLTWSDPEEVDITEDMEPYNEKPIDELSKGLEITLTDPEKGGIFVCKGEFESGRTATAQIRIRAIQRPTFVTSFEPLKEVNEGSRIEFNCQAQGIPPPTIIWLFGNQDISSIGNGRVLVEKGKLVIEDVQPSDTGFYYCAANIEERNEVEFANITLRVKFTPRLELPMGESFFVQVGEPMQYNFTVLANPVPFVSVAWKGKVFEGEEVKRVDYDADLYLFSFEFTPTSQEDISELLITATNDLGSIEKKITLQGDSPGLGTGSIVAIVLIILLVVLLIADVSCYYKRHRGLLMYCRTHILGKNSSGMGAENSGKVASKSGKSSVVNVSGIEA